MQKGSVGYTTVGQNHLMISATYGRTPPAIKQRILLTKIFSAPPRIK